MSPAWYTCCTRVLAWMACFVGSSSQATSTRVHSSSTRVHVSTCTVLQYTCMIPTRVGPRVHSVHHAVPVHSAGLFFFLLQYITRVLQYTGIAIVFIAVLFPLFPCIHAWACRWFALSAWLLQYCNRYTGTLVYACMRMLQGAVSRLGLTFFHA